MDVDLLKKIGLNDSQAKAYLALIKAGRLTPPQLAAKLKEGRTTAYMALAKLEDLGLARTVENTLKLTYAPTNPGAFEKLIQHRKKETAAAEGTYRSMLPSMLTYYYTFRGEPGIRFYQGAEGLRQIYRDHVRTGKDIKVFRTRADEYFREFLYQYLERRAKLGIRTETISPYSHGFYNFSKRNNKKLNRTVTLLPPKAYTAPVEISIYGDKISIISFGKETIATIIDSPQIAEAMRQIFAVAKAGAETLFKNYPGAENLKLS